MKRDIYRNASESGLEAYRSIEPAIKAIIIKKPAKYVMKMDNKISIVEVYGKNMLDDYSRTI